MENQLELIQPESPRPKMDKKVMVIAISTASLLIVLTAINIFLVNKFISLDKSLSEINGKYNDLQTKVSGVSAEVSTTVTDVNSKVALVSSKIANVDLTKVNSSIEDINRSIYLMSMQHRIERGLVTDDFIVAKASVSASPSLKLLSFALDLDTQPGAYSKYKGQGKFTVPDRELKSMLQDVIGKLKEYYDGSDQVYKDLPQWKDGTVYITIKNYEIGTYKNGELKLKGE